MGGGRALDVTIAKHLRESVLRGDETTAQAVCFPLGPHLMPDAVLCLCTKAGPTERRREPGSRPGLGSCTSQPWSLVDFGQVM